MLNWETWFNQLTESRVTLNDNLGMEGSYCYQISSDLSISSTWQTHILANTDTTSASNFKIRALVRKNTTSGCLYLFARANKATKSAYILELKDSISLYKGTLGVPYTGSYIDSSGEFIFPKNTTYHLEFAIHTGVDNKTFIQVKVGDREETERWSVVLSCIRENETSLSGYWGFGMGTYTRREQYYFDQIQYFLEY